MSKNFCPLLYFTVLPWASGWNFIFIISKAHIALTWSLAHPESSLDSNPDSVVLQGGVTLCNLHNRTGCVGRCGDLGTWLAAAAGPQRTKRSWTGLNRSEVSKSPHRVKIKPVATVGGNQWENIVLLDLIVSFLVMKCPASDQVPPLRVSSPVWYCFSSALASYEVSRTPTVFAAMGKKQNQTFRSFRCA